MKDVVWLVGWREVEDGVIRYRGWSGLKDGVAILKMEWSEGWSGIKDGAV